VIRDHGSRITYHESLSMWLRFIIYSILAYLILRFVRKLLAPAPGPSSRRSPSDTRSARMIRCDNCGMFVTQSSALLVAGREFCSRDCARTVKSV